MLIHYKRHIKNYFTEERNPTIVTFSIKSLDFSTFMKSPKSNTSYLYDLIANICYDSKQNSYKVHVKNRANDQWYEIQDLYVQEIHPQTIFLSEAYIQASILGMLNQVFKR